MRLSGVPVCFLNRGKSVESGDLKAKSGSVLKKREWPSESQSGNCPLGTSLEVIGQPWLELFLAVLMAKLNLSLKGGKHSSFEELCLSKLKWSKEQSYIAREVRSRECFTMRKITAWIIVLLGMIRRRRRNWWCQSRGKNCWHSFLE